MFSRTQTHGFNQPIEATMIQGTSVNIGYANLNMTNHQVNEANLEGRYALDLLRSHCSLAALVDANERYDPPRCAEATRRNIIQKMEDWVRHDNHHRAPSSIFWLYGGAGAGKSALAQTLAEKMKTNGDLAATFFFFKTDASRNDGDRLIPTLVHELVQSFPGLRPFVEEKILQNPVLFNKNRQTQMLELLIEPLVRLSLDETTGVPSNIGLKSHPRLVVIDGLDECRDQDTQCDLLRIVATSIPHSPYPLRFLITSRPESHITRAFQHDFGNVVQYDLSEDSDADKDIRNFLEQEFKKTCHTHPLRQHLPSQWPPQASISSLVERSSGHFIYASTVIRFIRSPKHRPDDRLEVVLGLKQPYKQDRPYARLDSLYRLIFLEIQDPDQLERIHHVLAIMHLRSLGVGFFTLSSWTSDRHAIETLLKLKPGDLVLLFDPLLSLVTFDKGNIRILHKTLFDYLLDTNRSGELRLDHSMAHETAADHLLQQQKSENRWGSQNFQAFVYHCQFARLNDTLVDHLRSLAYDSKNTFPEAMLTMQYPLLRSMVYFLQSIGRQDFDPSRHCYRAYVKQTTQHLKSAIPWSGRLKSMISWTPSPSEVSQISSFVEKCLVLYIRACDWSSRRFGSKEIQLNGLNGSLRVPVVNALHELFSCYVIAGRPRGTVVSFSELNGELVHSCYFIIRAWNLSISVMLVTYSRHGERVSCTELSELPKLPSDRDFPAVVKSLVQEHHQRVTQNEVDINHNAAIAKPRGTHIPTAG